VRYQYYRSRDGVVLFMASEREFWKNFCEGIGRPEMFERNPGAKYADHARGNVALRRELAEIFAARTTAEWIAFGQKVNTPLCPVNTAKTITSDPQFQARLPLRPYREAGTDLMPSPIKLIGEELPVPEMAAREPGRDTDEVLRQVLGYDDARIASLRRSGVLG
jgi:crotonobetainyl-CoA:carnitine CoA-transferase CaiB-like acyl-CoA transferase